QFYPNHNIKEIYISHKNLKGELNLSQYQQLERLYCHNNEITNIILPTSLKELDLSWNNFNQDLSFLVPYTNLEILRLGNNKFIGSLDYLSGMEQLKKLDIGNTDINEVQIDKLPRSLKEIEYYTDKRLDCKLTEIIHLLKRFEWQQLSGNGVDRLVVLKSLNNSQNITLEFLTEIANTKLVDDGDYVVGCHGISQDPNTKNYLMVMRYIESGNLRQYLQNKDNELSLENKFEKLRNIAYGLNEIHNQNLVHQDFHSGNILNGGKHNSSYITDLGLSRPVNHPKQTGQIFGVLPYVAPEVLQGQSYTKKADIYSFGIIAYELLANAYPYPEMNETELMLEVCFGSLRPNLDKVPLPQLLKDLIKSREIDSKQNTPFYRQYKKIEAKYNILSQEPYQIHSNAILHSKAINTKQINELLTKQFGTKDLDFNLDMIEELEINDQEEQIQTQQEIPPKQ
ncbi:11318_t:CDS:2, partial [Funneliformis geosporum]